MDWAKAFYGAIGAAYPTASLLGAILIGGLLAGAAWRAVATAYNKDQQAAAVARRPEPPKIATPVPFVPSVQPASSEGPRVSKRTESTHTATQRSSGANSPNVITHGANSPVIINPPMQPRIEGLTTSVRQIPSTRENVPYALEVTVQVQAEVSPFGVGFVCDGPIVGGEHTFGGNFSGVMMDVRTGTLNEAPDRSYFVMFAFPPMTPQRPLIITLFAKQPFQPVKTVRVVP